MGGNAITNSRRIYKDEYVSLCDTIVSRLEQEHIKCSVIVAYEDKETFGDMDILIQKETSRDLVKLIPQLFAFSEVIKNGDVISCNFNQFQIDFIFQNEEHFDFSCGYFSFNDLGNLIGRITHKMGFKFGHDGVWYCLRDGTHMFGEVCLTRDFETALEFFGFSHNRYLKGFKNLTEIFEYVVKSPYFNRDLYPLEHRNHYARMRDRKRKTYNEFLKYCNELPWDVDYCFYDKPVYLARACSVFPKFEEEYKEMQNNYYRAQQAKHKFNGELVGEWTGLKGKELGKFITYMKDDFSEMSSNKSWLDYVLMHEPHDIKTRTMIMYNFADWRTP